MRPSGVGGRRRLRGYLCRRVAWFDKDIAALDLIWVLCLILNSGVEVHYHIQTQIDTYWSRLLGSYIRSELTEGDIASSCSVYLYACMYV